MFVVAVRDIDGVCEWLRARSMCSCEGYIPIWRVAPSMPSYKEFIHVQIGVRIMSVMIVVAEMVSKSCKGCLEVTSMEASSVPRLCDPRPDWARLFHPTRIKDTASPHNDRSENWISRAPYRSKGYEAWALSHPALSRAYCTPKWLYQIECCGYTRLSDLAATKKITLMKSVLKYCQETGCALAKCNNV